MTLRKLVNNILTEGIAEVAGQKCFDLPALQTYLKSLKINKKDFLEQYPNSDIFVKRAFQVNNSSANFDNTIKPILLNFYNSLQ